MLPRPNVCVFVVGLTRLPAAEQNPDPFEGERANCGMVILASGSLLVIKSSGPITVLNR